MSLQVNPLIFSDFFFPVRKSKQNLLPVVKQRISQHRSIRCIWFNTVSEIDNRFAFYQPTIWSHDFIKTLDTHCPINCMEKIKELEKKLVMELSLNYENDGLSSLQLLELIDDIERLGVGYRFQNKIRTTLEKISSRNEDSVGVEERNVDDLYSMSLRFRLLRQHGYNVSQDFLKRFKENHGDFMEHLGTDVKGLLSVYEASFLAFEGEEDLHEAKIFATRHLLKLKGHQNEVVEHINHALELPLYRRMVRLQARWYIDSYSNKKDVNHLALELAILDFNMVQAALKKELQQVLKWWDNTGLASKLRFTRDRPVEFFFWSVGIVFAPEYDCCRIGLTKLSTLITIIDDIYDVYGSLDELKLFTDVVKRWDIDAGAHMPDYLQLSFMALHNTLDEMGNKTLVSQGVNIIAQVWGELCEAFFVEADWIHNKHMPTFEDYIENAWRSVSGVVVLTHAYFLINKYITKDALVSYGKCRDLFKWSSMIFRLCNDLASSNEVKKGESINAVTCYMQEKGVCEKVARQYIQTLIDEAWSKLIEARVSCAQKLPDAVIDMTINLARMSHCIYQYGDGIGDPDGTTKDRVLSVLIEPIVIQEKEAPILSLIEGQ